MSELQALAMVLRLTPELKKGIPQEFREVSVLSPNRVSAYSSSGVNLLWNRTEITI